MLSSMKATTDGTSPELCSWTWSPGDRSATQHENEEGCHWPEYAHVVLSPTKVSGVRRVINSVQTGDLRGLYNPESIFLSANGGGAGNNWGSGYHQAEAHSEEILEILGAPLRSHISVQRPLIQAALSYSRQATNDPEPHDTASAPQGSDLCAAIEFGSSAELRMDLRVAYLVQH